MEIKMKTLVLFMSMIWVALLYAQSDEPTGNLQGRVIDVETKSPLIGVNIYIKNSGTGTTTDENGDYRMKNLPLGFTTVIFSYIGYESVSKTDINILPEKTSFVNAGMKSSAVEIQDVVVTDGYFSEVKNKPVSTVNFSSEEIRRSPGTAGDVFQTLTISPWRDHRMVL
jgi:hypothetical protein